MRKREKEGKQEREKERENLLNLFLIYDMCRTTEDFIYALWICELNEAKAPTSNIILVIPQCMGRRHGHPHCHRQQDIYQRLIIGIISVWHCVTYCSSVTHSNDGL